MNRRTLLIGVGVVVVLAIAAIAVFLISSGSGEASAPISAPTLSLTDAATESPTAEAMAEPTGAPTDAPAVEAAAGERVLFRIVPEESQASFTLNEDLFNQPKTVVGTTDQVAGDIIIDFGAPASSELGTIRINVRTLQTDNDFRNRAIRGQILQSSQDAFEFADFTPTALNGLPDSVAVGDTITFEIVGDLKVRDIVQSTTWQAEVTLVSEDRLEGTASTVVTRAQYELTIPNVPNVANVTDEVTLALQFVATRVAE